jgi:hypothetical protein
MAIMFALTSRLLLYLLDLGMTVIMWSTSSREGELMFLVVFLAVLELRVGVYGAENPRSNF